MGFLTTRVKINEGIVFGVSARQGDGVVGLERALVIVQSPAPMIDIFELGDLEAHSVCRHVPCFPLLAGRRPFRGLCLPAHEACV